MHRGRDDRVGSELNVNERAEVGRLVRKPDAGGCFFVGDGVVMAEGRFGTKFSASMEEDKFELGSEKERDTERGCNLILSPLLDTSKFET
mmetsp:Transcript_17131/g.34861  ORF Transcript_17131/g.34861 Transcript_17131/m.34861 type:complete len:90 (+) Transcript_17131:4674-4943(+)